MTSRKNWEVINKSWIYGVSKNHLTSLKKVNVGDEILIFVRQEIIDRIIYPSIITGLFKIESEIFESQENIFLPPTSYPNEIFPFRVKIAPLKIFKKPIEFKPLVPNINFITNKKHWACHLQGRTIISIPDDDFMYIKNQGK